MIKELEILIKELNNGKLHGATIAISKMLNISNVSVHNWLVGKSVPSEDNIKKLAKKVKRNPEDIQKIFIDNSKNINSNNVNSFNNSDNKKEIELLQKEIKLKDKEIELLKKEMDLIRKQK